jgi:Fungal Zn(2)-Cys(6) binuclear cluster domain
MWEGIQSIVSTSLSIELDGGKGRILTISSDLLRRHVKTHPASEHVLQSLKRPKNICVQCTSSKVKCDDSFPKCSRCQRSGLPCTGRYEAVSSPENYTTAVTPADQTSRNALRIFHVDDEWTTSSHSDSGESKTSPEAYDGSAIFPQYTSDPTSGDVAVGSYAVMDAATSAAVDSLIMTSNAAGPPVQWISPNIGSADFNFSVPFDFGQYGGWYPGHNNMLPHMMPNMMGASENYSQHIDDQSTPLNSAFGIPDPMSTMELMKPRDDMNNSPRMEFRGNPAPIINGHSITSGVLRFPLSEDTYMQFAEKFRSKGFATDSSIIPINLPTRSRMNEFIEAYFDRFHHQVPVIHLPTFDINAICLDLVGNIIAVGMMLRARADGSKTYSAAFWDRCRRMLIETREGDYSLVSLLDFPDF